MCCFCPFLLDIIGLIFGRQVRGKFLSHTSGRFLLKNKKIKKGSYDLVVEAIIIFFFSWNYSEVGFGGQVANLCPTYASIFSVWLDINWSHFR